jgi:hypothetical protein
MAATSGIFVGVFEVVLLPLDALKVKGQTGTKLVVNSTPLIKPVPAVPPHGFPQNSLVSVPKSLPSSLALFHSSASTAPVNNITQVHPPVGSATAQTAFFNLYRGASWTASRNAMGCFTLFGVSTSVKEALSTEPNSPPTFFAVFLSSLAASTASILVAAPLDVIKVRVQAQPLVGVTIVKGTNILRSLLEREGPRALFKGVGTKLLASGPKVTFAFTVAQTVSSWISERF